MLYLHFFHVNEKQNTEVSFSFCTFLFPVYYFVPSRLTVSVFFRTHLVKGLQAEESMQIIDLAHVYLCPSKTRQTHVTLTTGMMLLPLSIQVWTSVPQTDPLSPHDDDDDGNWTSVSYSFFETPPMSWMLIRKKSSVQSCCRTFVSDRAAAASSASHPPHCHKLKNREPKNKLKTKCLKQKRVKMKRPLLRLRTVRCLSTHHALSCLGLWVVISQTVCAVATEQLTHEHQSDPNEAAERGGSGEVKSKQQGPTRCERGGERVKVHVLVLSEQRRGNEDSKYLCVRVLRYPKH